MRLCESKQEDIISKFQDILDIRRELNSAVSNLETECEDNDNLNYEARFLKDFCYEELSDKLKSMEDAILDEYYPINYGDDEEDEMVAADLYRESKNQREHIFNW